MGDLNKSASGPRWPGQEWADRFAVHLAVSAPVQVEVGAGAGQVAIGGTTHNGIAPGQSFSTIGWLDGRAEGEVQAVGGR